MFVIFSVQPEPGHVGSPYQPSGFLLRYEAVRQSGRSATNAAGVLQHRIECAIVVLSDLQSSTSVQILIDIDNVIVVLTLAEIPIMAEYRANAAAAAAIRAARDASAARAAAQAAGRPADVAIASKPVARAAAEQPAHYRRNQPVFMRMHNVGRGGSPGWVWLQGIVADQSGRNTFVIRVCTPDARERLYRATGDSLRPVSAIAFTEDMRQLFTRSAHAPSVDPAAGSYIAIGRWPLRLPVMPRSLRPSTSTSGGSATTTTTAVEMRMVLSSRPPRPPPRPTPPRPRSPPYSFDADEWLEDHPSEAEIVALATIAQPRRSRRIRRQTAGRTEHRWPY